MSEPDPIADFIAEHGVTRCPAACCAPTTLDENPDANLDDAAG